MPSTPQGHLLARAFDDLQVDGILCIDHTPLIYFRLVDDLAFDAVSDLHRRFWNHGGAPLLVLVSDQHAHIYSGMARPVNPAQDKSPNFVTRLDRVAAGLKEFIAATGAGEFLHRHQRSFDPAQRVDRVLLTNLMAARQRLQSLSPAEAHLQTLECDGCACPPHHNDRSRCNRSDSLDGAAP